MKTTNRVAKHPASFPKLILDIVDLVLFEYDSVFEIVPRRLLDPFVGIGGLGKLDWEGEVYGAEIEPEWALQARETGIITHVGDSRHLPWPDGHFGVICTSPTYGNRLADSYAPDLSDPKHRKRRSYRIYLQRELSQGNTGALHWGEEYRALHAQVWKESVRLLAEGGLFILNVKDHFRKKELQEVTDWHVAQLKRLGLVELERERIHLKGDQNTATMRKKGIEVVDFEWLVILRKVSKQCDQPKTPPQNGLGLGSIYTQEGA
jgi:hypothetical protein